MTRYKFIGYAYPTSTTAERLNVPDIGGYFIKCYYENEGVETRSRIWPSNTATTYPAPDDPALIDLFAKCEGKVCPRSMKYHSHYYDAHPEPANR